MTHKVPIFHPQTRKLSFIGIFRYNYNQEDSLAANRKLVSDFDKNSIKKILGNNFRKVFKCKRVKKRLFEDKIYYPRYFND